MEQEFHSQAVIERYLRSLRQMPAAEADIRGSEAYPRILGKAYFYQTADGVLVAVYVTGLPRGEGRCAAPVFAFHIHNGSTCTGDRSDPFGDVGTHYNPDGCPHPAHAGDLAPLFGNQGTAFLVFLTDRFTAEQVVGRTVVVHQKPDDFTTQPAGAAGNKIACGRIVRSGRG